MAGFNLLGIFDDFCSCLLKRDWSVDYSFSCDFLACFLYQGNRGLIKVVGKCSFLLYFLKVIVKK